MATETAKLEQENEAPRRRFSEFVGWMKAYKELLLAAGAIVGSVFLVLDYFATKSEVEILKCQLRAEVELTDSRVRIAESTSKLAAMKQNQAKHAASKASRLSESDAKLDLEIDREKTTLRSQMDREEKAEAKLRSGACMKVQGLREARLPALSGGLLPFGASRHAG
jgi:hypothetical protein